MKHAKYRSFIWWIIVLWSYISIIFWKYIGNSLYLRKNKQYIRDSIAYDFEHKNKCFDHLMKIYPEFYKLDKYLIQKNSPLPLEIMFSCITMRHKLFYLWSYCFEKKDVIDILQICAVQTSIKLRSGFQHSVVIVGYDRIKDHFIVHDPLGDFHSNYKIWYGAYVEFEASHFEALNTGRPFFIHTSVSPENEKVADIFKRKKYYWLRPHYA